MLCEEKVGYLQLLLLHINALVVETRALVLFLAAGWTI
jgi:hypothetical protein